jgi:hypothetical protein
LVCAVAAFAAASLLGAGADRAAAQNIPAPRKSIEQARSPRHFGGVALIDDRFIGPCSSMKNYRLRRSCSILKKFCSQEFVEFGGPFPKETQP